ncbi:Bax inhibitor-1/YccA family protein [Liberiplasma polymorphum]|jgi:uncharacterized YccA/Bax inhibitor family protein|uniref:Bax inhibitor-1/YccA family protein n=1 Tax=Liberiplasma polymorphum TaxID=3374570 RepID=UPI00377193EC
MRFRSHNPVFARVHSQASVDYSNVVTYKGVTLKTTFLLAIMMIVGAFTAVQFYNLDTISNGLIIAIIVAPIVGFICIIFAFVRPQSARIPSVFYAVAQGLFLGAISSMYQISFGDGIVATALLATLGVFIGMLILFGSGLIVVNDFFRSFMYMMLIGLVFSSLFFFIFAMITGTASIGFLFGITIVGVILASLYLLIDFDNIQKAVHGSIDKRYEWILSLGLLVTLIWLYLEILRLLAILRSRGGRR